MLLHVAGFVICLWVDGNGLHTGSRQILSTYDLWNAYRSPEDGLWRIIMSQKRRQNLKRANQSTELRNKGRSSGAAVKVLTERRFGSKLLEVHIHAKRSRCRRPGIRGPCSEIGPSLHSRYSSLAHNRASSQLTGEHRNYLQPRSPRHGTNKVCRLFTSLGNKIMAMVASPHAHGFTRSF